MKLMYFHVLLLCLLSTLSVPLSLEDPALNIVSSKISLFDGAPKYWHLNIRKYLHVSLKKFWHTFQKWTMTSFHFIWLKLSNRLMIHSQDRLPRPKLSMRECCIPQKHLHHQNERIMNKRSKPNQFFNDGVKVHRISGKLIMFDKANSYFLTCFGFYMDNNTQRWLPTKLGRYSWIFQPNKKISLNLTFQYINFSLSSVDCFNGRLSVTDRRFRSKYSFCEKYSSFSIFTSSSLFRGGAIVSITLLRYTYFDIMSFFMVLDAGLLSSIPVKRKKPSYSVLSKHLIQRKISYYLESTHVQTEKRSFLNLYCQNKMNQTHVVFDGPGFLSNKLKPIGKVYTTSTFQCFVQTLSPKQAVIKYKSRDIAISQVIHLSQNQTVKISIPAKDLTVSPISLVVKSVQNIQILTTITNMVYNTHNTTTCQFGGLAVFERKEEMLTMCEHHNGSVSRNREIYFSSQTATFVVFWYKFYGDMNVSLTVSQTKCKPVNIDSYKYKHTCLIKAKITKCNSYLAHISINSDMELRQDREKLYFSLVRGACTVLQVKQREPYLKTFRFQWSCYSQLFLMPRKILVPNFVLNYRITGSLKHIPSKYESAISFQGKADKFCGHLGPNGGPHCSKQVDKLSDTDFSVTAETETPTSQNLFWFIIYLLRWSKSWVNMQIWMTQRDTSVTQNNNNPESMFAYIDSMETNQLVTLLFKFRGFAQNAMTEKDITKIHVSLKSKLDFQRYKWDHRGEQILPYSIELSWTSNVLLSPYFPTKHISIPGLISEVDSEFSITPFSKELNGSGYLVTPEVVYKWITDTYYKYSLLVNKKAKLCHRELGSEIKLDFCANFSHFRTSSAPSSRFYIFFRRQKDWYSITAETKVQAYRDHVFKLYVPSFMDVEKFQPYRIIKISCRTAAQLCKHVGGSLPVFSAGEEADMLTALVKLSDQFPVVEAVYIDLIKKVRAVLAWRARQIFSPVQLRSH